MTEERRRFLTLAREHILRELMSDWRRRGTPLLQIGLSLSPEFFWDMGFDVTALDVSPQRLEAARAQTGSRVDYRLASPDDLPFEDGEFDYAVLAHQCPRDGHASFLRPGEKPADALLEARRVTAKGMILLDWNRFSLAGGSEARRAAQEEGAFSGSVFPWKLYSLVRKRIPACSVTVRSSLLFGEGVWPGSGRAWSRALRRFLEPYNLHVTVFPLGALLGVRVDWVSVPLTPAGIIREAAEALRPATPAPMTSGASESSFRCLLKA